ncbi:MAG TPA: ferritin-like domain-containing protein [Stellaceae bacterium]|nr:ferritin-like domain-containing protein [Stellaceae bacterium]
MAQGQSRRPCRRGAEGGAGALNSHDHPHPPAADAPGHPSPASGRGTIRSDAKPLSRGAGEGADGHTPEAGEGTSLAAGAVAVLTAADPAQKVAVSREVAAAWRRGGMAVGTATPPARPARPERPKLQPPREMRRRRNLGSPAGRIALIHALAHIELNAIDLGWDIIARFSGENLPHEFFDDWVGVAAEEAEHFALLAARLATLGAAYGDLPAHDGLWEAAAKTAHDLLARLAVVPLVLEARGLDVTPEMMRRLERAGDTESAAILERIYADEIGHVAVGARWFARLCAARGLDPTATFRDRVARHFTGTLKPPFNHAARAAAGLPSGFYAEFHAPGPAGG